MKIKYKITFSFVFVVALVAFGNMVATAYVLKSLQGERLKTSEIAFMKRLVRDVARDVIEEKNDRITSVLFDEKSLREDKIYYILIFDSKGYLLAHTFLTAMPKILLKLNHQIDPKETYKIERVEDLKVDVYDIAIPIQEGIKRIGTAHLGIKTSYVENIVTPTRKASSYAFGIALIMILLSIGVAALLSEAITKPISLLREGVLKIITGDWNSKITLRSTDELGQLAGAFNQMTDNLKNITASRDELNREISHRKTMEEELMEVQGKLFQSEKLASIGQLAAGVAHEINNPVGFISNNMEVLQEYVGNYKRILQAVEAVKVQVEAGDLQKAKVHIEELRNLENEVNLDFMTGDVGKLLEHSTRGLERIRKIVLDLRTFARVDNTETKELIKIEEVIDGILSIVQSELKSKAELVKDYGDTPLIECNPQRLGQVFINFLVNAAQAITDKGKIVIKTYQQDQHVCVDITDNGKGITEEDLTKIFDPFFTTKPVGQGTGLGLSVSYEIIKKHGGIIKVRSKLGEGTTFTVSFPLKNSA